LVGQENWVDMSQDLLAPVKNDFSMALLKELIVNKKAKENQKKAAVEENCVKEDTGENSELSSDSDSEGTETCTGALDLLKRYYSTDDDDLAEEKVDALPAKPDSAMTETGEESDTTSSSLGGSTGRRTGKDLIAAVGEEEDLAEKEEEVDEGEDDDDALVSPRTVTRALIRHAVRVTSVTRSFMENNPTKRQPEDLLQFPGKMDHATCVAFQV